MNHLSFNRTIFLLTFGKVADFSIRFTRVKMDRGRNDPGRRNPLNQVGAGEASINSRTLSVGEPVAHVQAFRAKGHGAVV